MSFELMRDCKDIQIDGKKVEEAGKKLCQFIDPFNVSASIKGPRRPLVIISFDESHILTDNPDSTEWTLFSELRRVFRELNGYPIFILFLSTMGRFNNFSPETQSDRSVRIRESHLSTLHPITEISFDDIAYPANEHTVTLCQVTKMNWMCHLGRPLYVCF